MQIKKIIFNYDVITTFYDTHPGMMINRAKFDILRSVLLKEFKRTYVGIHLPLYILDANNR